VGPPTLRGRCRWAAPYPCYDGSRQRESRRAARAGSRKSQGPYRSMSGLNQDLMRINLRRMELSAFIEYRAHIDQKAATGPPGRRHGGKGSAVLGPALDRKPLTAHRREVRNERIFRFVCLETACDAYVGAWPRRGSSAVALAEDRSVRPIPARASLYARPRPEMARKARSRRWALDARSISPVESR
jgi:hypothetical protein